MNKESDLTKKTKIQLRAEKYITDNYTVVDTSCFSLDYNEIQDLIEHVIKTERSEPATKNNASDSKFAIPVVSDNEERVAVCNLHIMCDHYSKNCHFDCKDYEPVKLIANVERMV